MRCLVLLPVLFALMLAACGPRTEPFRTAPRPEAGGYGSLTPFGSTEYDNAQLAEIFVTLTLGLESGVERKSLQRFEAPVRVGMIGPGSTQYRDFLEEFIAEIVAESAVPVSTGEAPYNLIVRFIPGEEFLADTTNQCVVVFGRPDWQDFQREPRRYTFAALEAQTQQDAVTIFIPDTIEPHKVRECLLEEITQALGPANDLYGLAETIFNDDNAHSWPTRLDYLMLRVLYDPRLQSGLSADEARSRALMVLDDVNPGGRSAPRLPSIRQSDFQKTRDELQSSLHPAVDESFQRVIIEDLAKSTRERFPDSAYDCTMTSFKAQFAESDLAETQLREAIELCARVHGRDDVRVAQLRLELAYADFDADRHRRAYDEARALLPVFIAHAQDEKIAAASILRMASAFRLSEPRWDGEYLEHAERWSAYAFGDDSDLTATLRF